MARILITGGDGFVGSRCVDALCHAGHHVIIARHQSKHKSDDKPLTEQVCFDIFKPDMIREAIKTSKPDVLLHMAWDVTPGQFVTADSNVEWQNASCHLIKECIQAGCSKIVTAGSSAEYLWNDETMKEGINEVSNGSLYGASKLAFFLCCKALCDKYQASYTHGRIFYTYGPGEHPMRIFPYVINQLIHHEKAFVSHGMQIRDYLYVDDVAAAFTTLVESKSLGAVNISSGIGVTLKECFLMMEELTGENNSTCFGAVSANANEPGVIVGNNQLLTSSTSWRPRYELKEGLRQTIAWWKARA